MYLSRLTCICRSYSSSEKVVILGRTALPLPLPNSRLLKTFTSSVWERANFRKAEPIPSPFPQATDASAGNCNSEAVHSDGSRETPGYVQFTFPVPGTARKVTSQGAGYSAGKSQASCPWARTPVTAALRLSLFHLPARGKARRGSGARRGAPMPPRGSPARRVPRAARRPPSLARRRRDCSEMLPSRGETET